MNAHVGFSGRWRQKPATAAPKRQTPLCGASRGTLKAAAGAIRPFAQGTRSPARAAR